MKTLLAALTLTTLSAALAAAQSAPAADWDSAAGALAASQVAALKALAKSAPIRPAAVLPASRGPAHRPQALTALLDRVSSEARAGRRPVVMFDLDDTLVDTAYRQMAILREFAAQDSARSRWPDAAAKMSGVESAAVHYDLGDTLKALGVREAPAILPELTQFWAARFFDNGYLMLDRANPGAVAYVRELVRRGGTAVYLTGRWEDMRPGTEASLAAMGFPPADGASVRLLMKPTKQESDLSFKTRVFDEIAGYGEVVGGFENEPANVDAYLARFPSGLMIFLDTRHSTGAPAVLPSIAWVADFRR